MKKFSLMLMMLFFGITIVLAQRTITGTMSDEKTKEPLIGARNRIKKSIQNYTFRGLRISTSKKNDTKMTQKRFLFEK
jgi:hypothetical protein